jgi:hypothetical protein
MDRVHNLIINIIDWFVGAGRYTTSQLSAVRIEKLQPVSPSAPSMTRQARLSLAMVASEDFEQAVQFLSFT